MRALAGQIGIEIVNTICAQCACYIDKGAEKGAKADPKAPGQQSPKPATREQDHSRGEEDHTKGHARPEQKATEQRRRTSLGYIDRAICAQLWFGLDDVHADVARREFL